MFTPDEFVFLIILIFFQTLGNNNNTITNSDAKYSAEEGFGLCGHFLIFMSYVILVIGMPFTLCCCIKVVQEYQRAVSSNYNFNCYDFI